MPENHLLVKGGKPLNGNVVLHAAKNAVLPLLAASVLTSKPLTVCDCPYITDVEGMVRILQSLGMDVKTKDRNVTVFGKPNGSHVPEKLACALRSSVFLLGPLLSETREVKLHYPGGCAIGSRPLDIHLNGLCAMGAKVEYNENSILCTAKKLKGAEIVLKYPSVGATENLLLAAVKAEGDTMLIGCAREPEIVSLCKALRLMGAKISGEGTPVIKISGVDSLDGVEYTPITDRIVAGTVLMATAVTGGKVSLLGARPRDLGAVLSRMVSKNISFTEDCSSLTIESDGKINPGDITTGPHPLFPTDLQAPYCAMQCYSRGQSVVCETVFENRFAHVEELKKMGADLSLNGNELTVVGKGELNVADLYASDLRGGAGLIIAALGAKGASRVFGLNYIDRGYEDICGLFASLGADISLQQ